MNPAVQRLNQRSPETRQPPKHRDRVAWNQTRLSPPGSANTPWYQQEDEGVFSQLETVMVGLRSGEAAHRLARYGDHELTASLVLREWLICRPPPIRFWA